MLCIDDIPQQVADDIHAYGVIWYATVQTQAKSGENIFFIVLSQKVQVEKAWTFVFYLDIFILQAYHFPLSVSL